MSTTSNEIFYSQVNKSLQDELNARGKSGFTRSTSDLNYMLTKIGNIELTAYQDQEYKTALYSLGGREVTTDAYVAGGKSGFLNSKTWKTIDKSGTVPVETSVTDNSYRIPPFISSAEIQLNDHSFGLLNSATILLIIPNPDRDLTFVESVFGRPGRAIRMKIAHPETALANKDAYLRTDPLPTGIEQLRATVREETTRLPKLNEVVFDGLIISFDYTYRQDGSVELTLYLRGKSDVYTDVSMFVVKKEEDTGNEVLKSFYEEIYNEFESLRLIPAPDTNSPVKFAYAGVGKTYTGNRKDYSWVYFTDWNNNKQRYVTLGYLVDLVNRMLISKQQSTAPRAIVYCTETICFSSNFEELVSADPENIWLPSSKNSITGTDVYGPKQQSEKRPSKWYNEIKLTSSELGSFYDNHPEKNMIVGHPSRILINLNVVKSIYDSLKTNKNDFNVSKFFERISSVILNATGGAVNMKLITLSYDRTEDIMLYYDANYLGDMYKVVPYSVPMFANHPYGTITREVKMQSKLPQNMQSLMYTINQSSTISEEMIAPFMSFMYNNVNITRTINQNGFQDVIQSSVPPDKVKDYEKQYTEFHKKYKQELATAKENFNLTNAQSKITLETALRKYVQYPDDSLKRAAQMISPVYPVEVEFTIDGINGFKYGDALQFDALPARYKTNTTFSIISIIHTINNTGEWTTKIKCIMRPKFNR
jgi:hypothetical protein